MTSPDSNQASSCQRTRSTIAGADIPAARYQARSLRSPWSVSAVTTRRVHTRPSAASPATSWSARCLPTNTSGSSWIDGVVERLLDAPLGRRLGAPGRTVVVAAGEPVGVPAGRSEAGQHVALRQRGQLAEAGQAHAGEQPDEVGVDPADLAQPGHRQRGQERRRPAGGDDPGRPDPPPGGDGRGEPPVGDAHADDDVGPGDLADGRHDLLGERPVTTEVARRAAGPEAQPPRLDDLQAGGEPADGPHDGLERPGVTIGVVVEQHDVGAALLGLATTLPDGHALGGGRRGPGDDAVGVQHHRRHLGRRPGGDDRPVRAPHRDHPRGGADRTASRPPPGRRRRRSDMVSPRRRRSPRATDRSGTVARTTGEVAVATVPSGPGSHRSARRGRGTRRPVAETATRRPRSRPHPCSTPSHTGDDAAMVMSASSGPGPPTVISTASRACTLACTRRTTAAFSRGASG